MTVAIKELFTKEEWLEVFPILKELRTHLDEVRFLSLTQEMVKDGYRLFALYDNGKVVGVTGIAIRVNFYYGKHIFVYDLVTSHTQRSKGYGKKLLEYVHTLAKANDCENVALESGIQREQAHDFYESKLGYYKFCYSFRKDLKL